MSSTSRKRTSSAWPPSTRTVSGSSPRAVHGGRARPPRHGVALAARGRRPTRPEQHAATPEAAVTALTSAVMAKDFSAAASVLTPLEGRLVADYQSTIGAELLDTLQPYTLTVEPTNVHVIDQGADWAIVEVDRWRFGASGAGDGRARQSGLHAHRRRAVR